MYSFQPLYPTAHGNSSDFLCQDTRQRLWSESKRAGQLGPERRVGVQEIPLASDGTCNAVFGMLSLAHSTPFIRKSCSRIPKPTGKTLLVDLTRQGPQLTDIRAPKACLVYLHHSNGLLIVKVNLLGLQWE